MSGVDVIGALLRDAAAVTAEVQIADIKAGALPDDAPLPSLLVRSVSEVERSKLKRVGFVRITERVAVTVRAVSYRDQRRIRKLLPSACAGKTGLIAGAIGVSTSNAGTGPDVRGPGGTYEQTIDFRVQFDTPA